MFGFWLCEIPLAWVLAYPAGLAVRGVFIAIPVSELFITLAELAVFMRGRWKKSRIWLLRNFYDSTTTRKSVLLSIGLMEMTSNTQSRYQDAHLEVDFNGKVLTLDSRSLVLTRKENELLSLLVRNAGDIVPREELLMRVWGYSNQIRTRTLDVHIRRLRTKLGEYSGQYIETIFGIGYRFQPFHASQRLDTTLHPALALTA